MKTSKECISCGHHSKFIEEHPCNVCITNNTLDCGFEKWEPIETKKMKTSKYSWARLIAVVWIIASIFIVYFAGDLEYAIIIIMILSYGLGYRSRRPHPNEKPLIIWLKVCKLKIQIGILKKNLKPFTDLRKYKHKSESHIREMVLEWRLELKELKGELSNILK